MADDLDVTLTLAQAAPCRAYKVGRATSDRDLAAAFDLRSRVFRGGQGDDRDSFDAESAHLLVRSHDDQPVACCRVTHFANGARLGQSYAAQFYDISGLAALTTPMIELGRFCVAPEHRLDADILRLAWGAVAAMVQQGGARVLFGCTSFQGVDIGAHQAALGWLGAHHPAPPDLAPLPGPAPFVRLGDLPAGDAVTARAGLPPLMRGYLAMGAWVGNQAVVDRDLGTIHVFTCVDVARIPAGRKRILLALAGLSGA